MTSTTTTLPSETRLDRKQQRDLAQARQAGTIAPATDHVTGQIINPHNPEFITKKPWYLQQQQQDGNNGSISGSTDYYNDSNAPTLQHQAVQQGTTKDRELSLTAAEELLQQQRQHEKISTSIPFVKGQWVEALKKNKAPYRICQVIKVHSNGNNNNNNNKNTMMMIDVQYEDGTMETKLKINNQSNPRPRVRPTAMGNRYATSSSSSSIGIGNQTTTDTTTTPATNDAPDGLPSVPASSYVESFVSKRDPYHGYDMNQHNTNVVRKYEQTNRIRRQIREQAQEQHDEQTNKTKEQQQNNILTANESKTNENDNSGASDASDDSDSDNDMDHNNNDDDDDDDDEFVQRDEDDVIMTTRLARQGGVGGAQMKVTARNLRIREDTAKYLYNLNVNSAYYDPKSRSMRDNPFGEQQQANSTTDYAGDNFVRISGDAVALAQQQLFAWDATAADHAPGGGDTASSSSTTNHNHDSTAANELHPIANPSQMELLQKTFRTQQETIRDTMKRNILDRYGGAEYLDGTDGLAAAAASSLPASVVPSSNNSAVTSRSTTATAADDQKLRFGVSTQVEEYTRDGRLVASTIGNIRSNPNSKKRQALESKYEENIFINGHVTVWGSYFHMGAFAWGYQDDHSLIKNSYCTGANGRMANDEANAMQYGTGQAGSATLEQVRRQMLPPANRVKSFTAESPNQRSKLYGDADPTISLNEQKVQETLRQQRKRVPESTSTTATAGGSSSNNKRSKKYNSNDAEEEMTPEMMEVYRIQKVNASNDPMANYRNE